MSGVPQRWDVLVVGGGTAGMTAARAAAAEGARVALVERDAHLGGECTHVGCVPSKALIEVARLVHALRGGARWGIRADGFRVDLPAVMEHVRSVVAEVARDERPEGFTAAGITLLHGSLRFLGPHSASIAGVEHGFARAVVATGSAPAIPVGIGLEGVAHLTNETVFALTTLPERLLVLGGGAIGLELGQAFSRLGSAVTVVDEAERVLPREAAEVSALVAEAMRDEGLDLRLRAPVDGVRHEGADVVLRRAGGDEVRADAILVATGRRPRVADLGLEELGVEHGPGGVRVDARMRTSAKHVFAAGDVTGGLLFTHVAADEGRVAGRNAAGARARVDRRVVPWVTFVDPEVARVGLTEDEARRRHRGVEVVRFPMERVDRARMLGVPRGVVTLITAARPLVGRMGGGRVVGAHIVGPHAGEMIQEIALAMRTNAFAGRLAQTIHAYPTVAMGVQQAASQLFPLGRALVDADEHDRSPGDSSL